MNFKLCNKIAENSVRFYNSVMDENNSMQKRWYDEKPYANNVLNILKELSLQSHYDIAREVLKIIETIKVSSRELPDPPISLGIERVLGLYCQEYKRRWYDRNLPVNRIFKSASSLQSQDFQNIMQGIYTSLKSESGQDE